jgi:hypothetical protein
MSDLVALPTLIFPSYNARIDSTGERLQIFDDVRKKFVALTPEEWVRQHCMHWLASRGYPLSRCSVERAITKSGMRYDIMFVDDDMKPFILVECKAPDVKVTTDTLRQGAWYNLTLRAPFVLLTNGHSAYCASVDRDGTVDLLEDIPNYPAKA